MPTGKGPVGKGDEDNGVSGGAGYVSLKLRINQSMRKYAFLGESEGGVTFCVGCEDPLPTQLPNQ